MSQIPQCPNSTDGSGACPRSDLVLAADTPKFWRFICRTCHLDWVCSKPTEKARAKWQNEVDRMGKATAAEKEWASRPRMFIAPKGGWS